MGEKYWRVTKNVIKWVCIKYHLHKFIANYEGQAIKCNKSGIRLKINEKLQTTISEFSSKIQRTADGYIDMAADKALELTNSFLDDKVGKFSEKLPDMVGGQAGKSSSIAAALKLGYSDYLKMFMFLKLCCNDDAVVKRIGDVIQINVGKGFKLANNKTLSHKKGNEFSLANAHTYIQVESTIKLKTMFLALPIVTEYTGKGGSAFTVKYKSAIGY